MTKEELIAAGADYDGGLTLCMDNEEFYFKMIRKGLANERFDSLKKNLDDKNLDAAFEDAHALKGVVGNLHLTPLYKVVEAIVEPLRRRDSESDYQALYEQINEQLKIFREMSNN